MTSKSAGSPQTRSERIHKPKGSVRAVNDFPHMVVIGRFQPLHNGHLALFSQAFARGAKYLTILVGSARNPRNPRNPFRYIERQTMLRLAFETASDPVLRAAFKDGVIQIYPLPDYTYDDDGWKMNVQENIRTALNQIGTEKTKTAIFGYSKDPGTERYLKMFGGQYGEVNATPHFHIGASTPEITLDATYLRNMFFESENAAEFRARAGTMLPESVLDNLQFFRDNKREYRIGLSPYEYILEEYQAMVAYPLKWGKGPFVTTDAVVVQSGHMLMIERGRWPGKGMLAFPGGFLEPGLTLLQNTLKELREETRIKVPEHVLMGSLMGAKTYDDPHRDLRGRMLTTAHHIRLRDDVTLPEVRGGDDAASAEWRLISEIYEEDVYADHLHMSRDIRRLFPQRV